MKWKGVVCKQNTVFVTVDVLNQGHIDMHTDLCNRRIHKHT
jgi:hypothetical protein